jgi:hypothetical protein
MDLDPHPYRGRRLGSRDSYPPESKGSHPVLPDQSDDGPQSPSPASLRADLQRAHAAITEAELAANPSERFLAAHLAALRVAAIILRVRAGSTPSRQPGRPRNAWRLVAEVAPEFAEWAGSFAATEAKRDAVRSGATTVVTAREADDLVRDARAFLSLVERSLG